MPLEIVTLRARPDLRAAIFAEEFRLFAFPEFMRHDPVADLYYAPRCLDRYLDFVLAGLDDGEVVARAFSVPFAFNIEGRTELPDAGWDEVIRWAHEDHVHGRNPRLTRQAAHRRETIAQADRVPYVRKAAARSRIGRCSAGGKRLGRPEGRKAREAMPPCVG